MSGKWRNVSGTMLAACAVLAGCGEGDDGDSANNPARGLDQPLYPRCGTKDFAKPRVTEITSEETKGRAWSLQYARRRPASPKQTTTILLVDASTATALSKKRDAGVKDVVVAGRRVAFLSPGQKRSTFGAQWRTKRAVYSAIANGSNPTTLRRFIACLP